MENLPEDIMLEIMGRIQDAADLSRLVVTSPQMLNLSKQVNSIRFFCTYSRLMLSRRFPESATPLKTMASAVLQRSLNLKTLRFDMEATMQKLLYADEDGDLSDCWLTDPVFIVQWLPAVADSLISLSITDFWQQSCWRCNNVLHIISTYCANLRTLELKNAWLSVHGVQKMDMVTSLTLDFIRLDDENLCTINKCFPALESLHLIQVGGLKHPYIQLANLKICHWILSSTPDSLALNCPALYELKLDCMFTDSLAINAPSLSFLDLSMVIPGKIFAEGSMPKLREVSVCCRFPGNIIRTFSERRFVEKLYLDHPKEFLGHDECQTWVGNMLTFNELQGEFPYLKTLSLGPGAWYVLEEQLYKFLGCSQKSHWNSPRKLLANIAKVRKESAFMVLNMILDICPMLTYIEIFFLGPSQLDVQDLISKAQSAFPHVRWKSKALSTGSSMVDSQV